MIQVSSLAGQEPGRPALLTIGSFDGLHLGHQSLIRGLVSAAHAQAGLAVVVTFQPHPSFVLRGPRPGFYLTAPPEKAALLEALGIDLLLTHPFTPDIAQWTAGAFMANLSAGLSIHEIWAGADFAFGHDREGNLTWLREHGYKVQVAQPLVLGGEIISSSRVRRALADGDLAQTNACLGRHFRVAGQVVEGNKRGRTIGIPTANLQVEPDRACPARGVYACRAWVEGRPYQAVTNIGVRPTFGGDPQPTVETHLLDFSGDLYGQTLPVDFVAHLRAEQKFNGIQELLAQIQTDIAHARQLLAE